MNSIFYNLTNETSFLLLTKRNKFLIDAPVKFLIAESEMFKCNKNEVNCYQVLCNTIFDGYIHEDDNIYYVRPSMILSNTEFWRKFCGNYNLDCDTDINVWHNIDTFIIEIKKAMIKYVKNKRTKEFDLFQLYNFRKLPREIMELIHEKLFGCNIFYLCTHGNDIEYRIKIFMNENDLVTLYDPSE